jgi:hypothetical protein
MSVLSSPPETTDRRLIDQIGGVDTKDNENSLATAQKRITIPQSCSQQVSHHTEWDMEG